MAHTVTGYEAVQGYNLVTGVGTVDASMLVYELAGVPAPEGPMQYSNWPARRP